MKFHKNEFRKRSEGLGAFRFFFKRLQNVVINKMLGYIREIASFPPLYDPFMFTSFCAPFRCLVSLVPMMGVTEIL